MWDAPQCGEDRDTKDPCPIGGVDAALVQRCLTSTLRCMADAQPPPNHSAPLSFADARRLLLIILLLVVACLLLRALVPVVLLFAIVLLLAMVLNPVVVCLERRRIPRPVSVALLLLGVVAIAVLIGAIIVPEIG